MLLQFLLYSKVTQSYIYIHSFCHTVFHYVLSQEIGYSSLCYTVGPHCLSISKCNSLHLLTLNSQSIPLPPPAPLATTCLFSMSMSLLLFCKWVHLCPILDSTYKWYHMVFIFLFLLHLVGESLVASVLL